MPKLLYRLVLIAFLFSSFYYFPPAQVRANISSCTVGMAPHQVTVNSETFFDFSINNFDPTNNVTWIKITRPNSNFAITQTLVSGWSDTTTSQSSEMKGGSIVSNTSLDLQLKVQANAVSPAANWVIEVSDDLNGANPISCNGNLDTEITCGGADCVPPIISNLAPSNLTTRSVKINWTTDEPATSVVHFGPTASYGFTESSPQLVLNHSITLTGLNSDTDYHYSVDSADSSGNTGSSADGTFLTAAGGSETSTTSPEKINLKPTEKNPPTIFITSDLSGFFKTAPLIKGEADDNVGVFLVEYSLDGGKNWLPVDKLVGKGEKKAEFEFTPQNLEDGNYTTLARATDTSGNIGLSAKKTLVIDRLPPIVGGSVLSIGPQILNPNQQGVINTVVGVDQKITLNSIGGAISIKITAVALSAKTISSQGQSFQLSHLRGSGLWSGVLRFEEAGVYKLVAKALDGAKNTTERQIATVNVLSGGEITDKNSKQPLSSAKLTLYYLEPEANSWVEWDGASFNQDNPQKTDSRGQFKLFVPAGKYYLKIEAKGYRSIISKIFSLQQTTPIVQAIEMVENWKISFGAFKISLPSLPVENLDINTAQATGAAIEKPSLLGSLVPNFNLLDTNGETLNPVELAGKPTLITVVSSWSPASQEQFKALEDSQANSDINIVPLAALESLGKLKAYKAISRSKLDFLVDPDGTTVNSFAYQSLPTHYFVSRRGIIKKVVVGVLSKEEILSNLGGL